MEIKTTEDIFNLGKRYVKAINDGDVKTFEEMSNANIRDTKWVRVDDVKEMQFQVQKWCIEYFDMDTKEIIKLNKIFKIKEMNFHSQERWNEWQ